MRRSLSKGRSLLGAAPLLVLLGAAVLPAAGPRAQELQIPAVLYPNLPREAAEAQGFVPPGWELETQVSGDMNRDGIPDLALVVRQKEPRNIVPNENGLGVDRLDTNPRILAVAFRNGQSQSYSLQLENHALIPRREDPVLDDPLSETGGVAIERGALKVSLHHFASAGGWGMGTTTFTFQFRNGQFELIGYDRNSVMRNSGETEETSINYLSGKMKLARGNIAKDDRKIAWKKVAQRPLFTIDRIGDGMAFDPAN